MKQSTLFANKRYVHGTTGRIRVFWQRGVAMTPPSLPFFNIEAK